MISYQFSLILCMNLGPFVTLSIFTNIGKVRAQVMVAPFLAHYHPISCPHIQPSMTTGKAKAQAMAAGAAKLAAIPATVTPTNMCN